MHNSNYVVLLLLNYEVHVNKLGRALVVVGLMFSGGFTDVNRVVSTGSIM